MGKTLTSLPNELLLRTCHLLSRPDLARLSAVCKSLSAVTQSILWTDIEFHSQTFHESPTEVRVPAPFQVPAGRSFHAAKDEAASDYAETAIAFFVMLYNLIQTDQDRLRELAGRVRSLCTAVPYDWGLNWDDNRPYQLGSLWPILPYFTNLEYLELHACNGEEIPSMDDVPVPKLRFAKLYGHFPRAVAAWVLRAGPTLERLELALFNPQKDPPRGNEISGEDPGEGGEDGEDSDEDQEWTREDILIPRPIGNFLPTDVENGTAELRLPRLKHLSLCRPCEGDYSECYEEFVWSRRDDKASLEAWRRLLEASSPTLETLVLDHRLGAEYIIGDGLSEVEFLQQCYSKTGTGLLIKMVKKVLAEGGGLPSLKELYLYGIPVTDRPAKAGGTASDLLPAGRLVKSLQSRGVKWEARLGQWMYFERHGSGVSGWGDWIDRNWNDREDVDDDDYDDDDDDDDYYYEELKTDTLVASG